MKRGTLILTIAAGALVFLAVLFFYLPASWFAAWLPPQVRCAQLGGSVWHGECRGLAYQGGSLGDATWNLSPGGLFTGRLVGDVDLRGTGLALRANVDLGFDQSGELSDVSARIPLDPAIIPQFSAQQRGTVTAELQRLVLAPGGFPTQAAGIVELHDFRQVSPRPLPLGSYRLTLDGSPSEDGLQGQLRDLGGPFAVEGIVKLSPPNQYTGRGRIAGRGAEAEGIVRQITFGAPPDASGRTEFNFEGTF
jgi:hypothetical protein